MSTVDRGNSWQVEVSVDGKSVPLYKQFIHDMIGASVDGLVEELRGVDTPLEINVRVVRLDSNEPGD